MSVLAPVADWVTIFALAAGGGALWYIDGFHRPFSLTDISIAYPDKGDIVSVPVLVVVSIIIPAIIMAGLSILIPFQKGTKLRITHLLGTINIPISALGLSLASTLFITTGLKDIIGKPRPNLLARCVADTSRLAEFVVGGLSNDVPGALVRSEICQQPNKRRLDDAFASFPSGHSSISCAGLVFLSIWLLAVLQVPFPLLSTITGTAGAARAKPLWQLVLALTPATVALFICTSRYADFHHAGIDIFAGALVGTITAITSFRLYYGPHAGNSIEVFWMPRVQADLLGRTKKSQAAIGDIGNGHLDITGEDIIPVDDSSVMNHKMLLGEQQQAKQSSTAGQSSRQPV